MAIHNGEQILPTNAFEGFADESEDKSFSDLPGADVDDSPEETIAKTRPRESNDLDDDNGGLDETTDESVTSEEDTKPTEKAEASTTTEDDEDFIPLIEDEDEPPIAADGEQPKLSKKEKFDRYSRSVQKRINKEVKQREALRAQNEALRQEVEQIKQSMQKEKANEALAIIDNRLRNATAIKQNLMEEGEYKQAAEVDNDIIEMRIKRERLVSGESAPMQAPPAQHGYPQEHYPTQPQQPPAGGYAPTSQASAPNAPTGVPTVQTNWIQNNPRFGREAGYTAYVNEVYDGMVEQGYNPADPNMYAELDRRIGRSPTSTPAASAQRAPAAPPPNSGRQAQTSSTKSRGLTEADKVNMRGWNLDPNNVEHRKEWLRNKT